MRFDGKDFAQDTDPLLLQLKGMVRRMAISLTAKALWQLVGFRQADGTTETRQAEPFTGIGFYSRPPSSGKPEAIVLMVGDANAPIAVATRDEKTRAAVAGALEPDEAMMFNSAALVYVKADGTIEARTKDGTAVQIPRLADLAILIEILNGAGVGAGTAIPAALALNYDDPTNPTKYIGTHVAEPFGLQKLKGE